MTPDRGNHPALLLPLPRGLRVSEGNFDRYLRSTGISIEKNRAWTDGPVATLSFVPPRRGDQPYVISLELQAFVRIPELPEQTVEVMIDEQIVAEWRFQDDNFTVRGIPIAGAHASADQLTIQFSIPHCARPSAFGTSADQRQLGISITGIGIQEINESSTCSGNVANYGRNVGTEAKKSFHQKLQSGFWDRYITGSRVLDIGFKGGRADRATIVPIVEGAIGIDLDYPGYDGYTLPFETHSQDAVFSSHCLEHIPHFVKAIQEWHRVTKIGGHIITVVPNSLLYEKRRTPPSRWNPYHHRFYTAASLLAEFERSLPSNSYRVRHLAENDSGYDYGLAADQHPVGCYEIELVVQKIAPPAWRLDD